MTYFLDTDICIYHLNGSAPDVSRNLLRITPANIRIPSIVAAELLFGAEKSIKREHNLGKVRLFLSLFDIVHFCGAAAEKYAVIRCDLERRGMIIGGNDLIIAATVIANDGMLVTNNIGEFSRVKGLVIADFR